MAATKSGASARAGARSGLLVTRLRMAKRPASASGPSTMSRASGASRRCCSRRVRTSSGAVEASLSAQGPLQLRFTTLHRQLQSASLSAPRPSTASSSLWARCRPSTSPASSAQAEVASKPSRFTPTKDRLRIAEAKELSTPSRPWLFSSGMSSTGTPSSKAKGPRAARKLSTRPRHRPSDPSTAEMSASKLMFPMAQYAASRVSTAPMLAPGTSEVAPLDGNTDSPAWSLIPSNTATSVSQTPELASTQATSSFAERFLIALRAISQTV
mmetsp:Transcript_18910/g.26057  ORF Transcript_18910/g.26057 Transcript_18910/m.26057 type:complete len:270 (+) Transcript_18910:479-1288(+)